MHVSLNVYSLGGAARRHAQGKPIRAQQWHCKRTRRWKQTKKDFNSRNAHRKIAPSMQSQNTGDHTLKKKTKNAECESFFNIIAGTRAGDGMFHSWAGRWRLVDYKSISSAIFEKTWTLHRREPQGNAGSCCAILRWANSGRKKKMEISMYTRRFQETCRSTKIFDRPNIPPTCDKRVKIVT